MDKIPSVPFDPETILSKPSDPEKIPSIPFDPETIQREKSSFNSWNSKNNLGVLCLRSRFNEDLGNKMLALGLNKRTKVNEYHPIQIIIDCSISLDDGISIPYQQISFLGSVSL